VAATDIPRHDDGDIDLAIRAAWLYYVDGLTQAQVATRLFVSRPAVGRFLARARSVGIVRIEIDPGYLASVSLARRLQNRWDLAEALVVPSVDEQHSSTHHNERLAAAAASYVRRHLHPGMVLGVAWGDTVQRVLALLPPAQLEGVMLATPAGGIDYITRRIMGQPAIAGHLRIVPAPLIVSSSIIANAFRNEPAVRDVLNLARGAEMTLTGIGNALPDSSAARSGLVTNQEVSRFAAAGAVGDMLGEWFTAHGDVLTAATSDRRVGLELATLRTLPQVVGVAGGVEKASAIRGALEGHYLNVLVTDEQAAVELLRSPDPTSHVTRHT